MAISVNGGGSGSGRRRFHGAPALSEINVTQFVEFDAATDDGSGDGPYSGSEILVKYLFPAGGTA